MSADLSECAHPTIRCWYCFKRIPTTTRAVYGYQRDTGWGWFCIFVRTAIHQQAQFKIGTLV
jgi:hypothetical protein